MSESKKSAKSEDHVLNLDDVLVNELGQFGLYQLRNVCMLMLIIFWEGLFFEYLFTSAQIPHRCRIPECGESGKNALFSPVWINNAVPETNSGCERFAPTGEIGSEDFCSASLFNQSKIVSCEDLVYAGNNSVVYEFNLGCNEWLRSLTGALSPIGAMIALPLSGYFSDRWGRKALLLISIFNAGLFGTVRAFSFNYTMYLVLHFIQSITSSGIYSGVYLLMNELLGPKYRVLVGVFMGVSTALGSLVVGGLAWAIQDWRLLTLVAYTPFIFLLSLYFFLSESFRWQISKQKFEEARKMLENVARINKTKISEKSLNALLQQQPEQITNLQDKPGLLKTILHSPVLFRRACTTPFYFMAGTLLYYGLTVTSISLSEEFYLNFILTMVMDIPGLIFAMISMNRFGRRVTLAGVFFLCAICNIAFVFVPNDMKIPRLILYLVGKFGSAAAVVLMYQFTSELYPTEYRHTLVAFSSMIGRVGNIIAQFTPALKMYWEGLPSAIFAGMGFLASVLALTQPETRGMKMPDTLAESEAIGK